MRHFKTLATVTLIYLALLLSSCTKSNSTTETSDNSNANVQEQIKGTWIIKSYTERTEDKSSAFKGISFNFAEGGQLKATSKDSETVGTWVYRPSAVAYYGSTATKASITLSLGNASPFNRLNRTWNIESSSATSLVLVNPEPNNDERIQFGKE